MICPGCGAVTEERCCGYIERLEREIAKLRAALQSIVDYPDLAANAPHIARAALQKENGDG